MNGILVEDGGSEVVEFRYEYFLVEARLSPALGMEPESSGHKIHVII